MTWLKARLQAGVGGIVPISKKKNVFSKRFFIKLGIRHMDPNYHLPKQLPTLIYDPHLEGWHSAKVKEHTKFNRRLKKATTKEGRRDDILYDRIPKVSPR